jgi:DNA polymerase-3 subunit epsilon
VLVAHNAAFDKSCLMQANSLLGIEARHDFICTCQNARRLLPTLPDHKLPTVADALAVRLANHHNALDDALAAAQIAVELSQLGRLE